MSNVTPEADQPSAEMSKHKFQIGNWDLEFYLIFELWIS